MSISETVIAKFQERFGEAPAHIVCAPGRVNLFGEHVDQLNDCHVSLRDLYEVCISEMDMMVRVAQSLPGCYGRVLRARASADAP